MVIASIQAGPSAAYQAGHSSVKRKSHGMKASGPGEEKLASVTGER